MELTRKEKTLKVIRIFIFLIVTTILLFYSVKYTPFVLSLMEKENMLQFKEKIDAMGVKGFLVILVLQVLQIIVAVVPGQPIELLTGAIYGPMVTVILCTLGAFIGTAVVFFVVRKIGTDFIELFFSREKINEIKETRVFKNPAKFEFLLFLVFVIPAIPKDIFIYVAGLSPVRGNRFLFISTLARIPGLLIVSYAGNQLQQGSVVIPIVILVAIILIAWVGYEIYKQKKDEFEKQEEEAENVEKHNDDIER